MKLFRHLKSKPFLAEFAKTQLSRSTVKLQLTICTG